LWANVVLLDGAGGGRRWLEVSSDRCRIVRHACLHRAPALATGAGGLRGLRRWRTARPVLR